MFYVHLVLKWFHVGRVEGEPKSILHLKHVIFFFKKTNEAKRFPVIVKRRWAKTGRNKNKNKHGL